MKLLGLLILVIICVMALRPAPSEVLEPKIQTTNAPTPQPTHLPTQKSLKNGAHTFQTFNNCGPASLSMTLSYFGIEQSQNQLGLSLRPYQHPTGNNDDKSVTLAELAAKAEELGLITYHRPAGDIDLLRYLIANDLPIITRTWLKPGEDIGHYRVIKGYDDASRTILQDDSLQGKNLSYSYEDFLSLWKAFNYEFLVVAPVEKKALVESLLGIRANKISAWEHALDIAKLENDLFNQSIALYHLGKYPESISLYEQVEAKLPKRMLWYQIEPILAYYKTENYDRVLNMSEKIIANQNRAYSELYYLQGLVYQKLDQRDKAQVAFTAADQYNSSTYWKNNLSL